MLPKCTMESGKTSCNQKKRIIRKTTWKRIRDHSFFKVPAVCSFQKVHHKLCGTKSRLFLHSFLTFTRLHLCSISLTKPSPILCQKWKHLCTQAPWPLAIKKQIVNHLFLTATQLSYLQVDVLSSGDFSG